MDEMTVKELIEALQSMPQDARVILSRDPEGNGYSPLADVDDKCIYTKRGDVYSTTWTAEQACMTEDQWQKFKQDHKVCIVLSPLE